ncbi:MAG TPA: ribosomal protein S18-alanine N-acetyltransferase [Clostridia bacterium]|nr:ribosomal protein S18-alanine N-acetyltransferase [Clostridia bacterium]
MAAAEFVELEKEKDLYQVVPMGENHLDEVLAIESASFPTPWSRNAFLGELFDNQFAYYYVCLKEGRVVGYVGMWIILDEAHVTNIAIHPFFRGRKLGKLLLTEIMGRAVCLGADKITLEVRPSNKVARSLYRQLGFVAAGIRKGYYSDTREDAIVMWKHLFGVDKR